MDAFAADALVYVSTPLDDSLRFAVGGQGCDSPWTCPGDRVVGDRQPLVLTSEPPATT
jgi:hypothetical protein